MKRINPSGRAKSSKTTSAAFSSGLASPVPAILVALATAAAFLPVLRNEFVTWDDQEMLLDNPFYRGFGWTQLRWMFTTLHMGPYQPLSWLTFAVDHFFWGMNPFGYHLTNLLLHSLNAWVFYFVARQLLRLACPESGKENAWPLQIAAAFAALCFALHPLRVESVAWATERRDVLSGLFYLSAIVAYLRAQASHGSRAASWRWIAATLGFYLLSLLSKATAMTFPIVLVLLDIYPLRRIDPDIRRWAAPQARKIWVEKLPFVFLALIFAMVAIVGQQQAAAVKSLEVYGIGSRVAQAFFGMGFYVWKTLVPMGLSPLYEAPPDYGIGDTTSLLAGAAVVLVSALLFYFRNRCRAVLFCWLSYLVVVAPVLGLVPTGPQLVADRYSYLSCLSWAVLAGGVLLKLLERTDIRRGRWRPLAIGGALSIAVVLGILTWRQCLIWRNTETLWARAVKLDPNGSFAHYNLAREIARKGRYREAIDHYRDALRARPDDADSHNNLGQLFAITGQVEASLAELRRAIEINPNHARAYYNLGRVLAAGGIVAEAEAHLRKALRLEPNEAEIHLVLGAVLQRQGQVAEAGMHFEEAVRLRPNSADAHVALARWLAARNEKEKAESHYREALRIYNARKREESLPHALQEGAKFPIGDRNAASPGQ